MVPPTKKTQERGPRIRRTAEEAREQILQAAEARLRNGGPEAVRLQDIARDVGISHPTILHHFSNREGLTKALGIRISERLVSALLDMLTEKPATEDNVVAMIDQVFATMGDGGTARLMAWRAMSFEPHEETARAGRKMLETVTEFLHERRLRAADEEGTEPPPLEDSRFLVRLALTASLGDALTDELWDEQTPNQEAGDHRFRVWFARLLLEHFRKQ